MIPFSCSASIVTYNNTPAMIIACIESVLASSLAIELHIIDNSKFPHLRQAIAGMPVRYHFTGRNLGYGAGHNLIINDGICHKYHIIINPDIVIHPKTLERLYEFMEVNQDVGIVCPKVLNEDGSIQMLNKRYPTLFDLFVRRFLPERLKKLVKHRLDRYEMQDVGYDDICEVEFLTGSFMFCRRDALAGVSGFDDRYFMYLEDADLCKLIEKAGFRKVYLPDVAVTHLWERASYKSIEMTLVHVKSAITYFNKWGWKLF